MTPARLSIAAAGIALAVLLVVGLTQLHGAASTRPVKLSLAQMRAGLAGSAAPLAALHAQANEVLPGGLDALRTRIAGLRGRPVVINKWASWCAPCRSEFGAFQRVSVALGRRVAFIGIDSGDSSRGDAIAFLRSFPVSYPSYYDPGGRAGLAITDSTFTPVTVFYTRSGAQFIHQGPYPSAAKLEADVRRYALAGVALPELRIDPLSGHRTIVAGERSRRPGGAPTCEPPAPIDPAGDPFAEGHEDRTPPELYALRPGGGPPDSPGWTVRVVPNLYPALASADGGGDDTRARGGDTDASGGAEEELFAALPATGAHEVIVNSPQPVHSLADLPVAQVREAMEVWRSRMREHGASAYVQLIVNERREAGASLPHTHSQLYALDFVPAAVARERERAGAYTTRTMGGDLLADLVQEEVRRRERIVAIDDEAVLLAPYASRLPYQMLLAPRTPRLRFEEPGASGAALLHDGLRRLARLLGSSPPLNMWVRTAPAGAEHFCWRIDVLPRLTHVAGLELATDVNLNIVAPEDAAAALRDCG